MPDWKSMCHSFLSVSHNRINFASRQMAIIYQSKECFTTCYLYVDNKADTEFSTGCSRMIASPSVSCRRNRSNYYIILSYSNSTIAIHISNPMPDQELANFMIILTIVDASMLSVIVGLPRSIWRSSLLGD